MNKPVDDLLIRIGTGRSTVMDAHVVRTVMCTADAICNALADEVGPARAAELMQQHGLDPEIIRRHIH